MFIFIGYDTPDALAVKHDHIIPILNLTFHQTIFEDDIVHIISNDSDVSFVADLLYAYNNRYKFNLTYEVIEKDYS